MLDPVCVRVDYSALRVCREQGDFYVKRIHAILFDDLAKIFGHSIARYPAG